MHAQGQLDVPQRRACRVPGQHRSTQRYAPHVADDEARLVKRMQELVRLHPRRGYRLIWGTLRLEGWRVNRKRVYRLWRREGLRVPRKQHGRQRLAASANGMMRESARRMNDVWCWDFVHGRDERGRPLRWLTLVDEFTRECVALEVAGSMTSDDAIDVLVEAFKERGAPRHIRSDHGPEFIAKAIRAFLSATGVKTLYIEPGSPWQSGFSESFTGRVRDELLNAEIFKDVRDAKALDAAWRHDYDRHRPHSSLGHLPPARLTATLSTPALAAAPLASKRPESDQANVTEPLTLIAPGTYRMGAGHNDVVPFLQTGDGRHQWPHVLPVAVSDRPRNAWMRMCGRNRGTIRSCFSALNDDS